MLSMSSMKSHIAVEMSLNRKIIYLFRRESYMSQGESMKTCKLQTDDFNDTADFQANVSQFSRLCSYHVIASSELTIGIVYSA